MARPAVTLAALFLAVASAATVASVGGSSAAARSSHRAPPVLSWLSVSDLDRLHAGKAGGITLAKLKASGIAGNVVMLQEAPESVPEWMVKEWTRARRYGLLYIGVYIAAPLPSDWEAFRRRLQTVADAANRAGANGLAFDAEPYGSADTETAWNLRSSSERAAMRANAESLAPIIKSVGDLVVYPSSDASFPGSYNDVIRAQNGEDDTYAKSLFPDFLDGLIAGGVHTTLLDASFQSGPQRAGDDWDSGISKSVGLTTARFSGLDASAMLWPDNDESHGPFRPDDVRDAFTAALRYSTGPVVLYQHTLADASAVGAWRAWLAAIEAATRP